MSFPVQDLGYCLTLLSRKLIIFCEVAREKYPVEPDSPFLKENLLDLDFIPPAQGGNHCLEASFHRAGVISANPRCQLHKLGCEDRVAND